VPGNIHKVQSRGAHALIKQGATLVESADDVVSALNNRALPFDLAPKPAAKASARRGNDGNGGRQNAARNIPAATPVQTVRDDLTGTENRIYLALDVEPRHIDDVATTAQMGAAEANATLVMLELKGVARRLPGNMFARVT
jgi:DNA processing protein